MSETTKRRRIAESVDRTLQVTRSIPLINLNNTVIHIEDRANVFEINYLEGDNSLVVSSSDDEIRVYYYLMNNLTNLCAFH